MRSVMWRCHPCQERASRWSRPGSSLPRWKHSSMVRRKPAAPASSASAVPFGANTRSLSNVAQRRVGSRYARRTARQSGCTARRRDRTLPNLAFTTRNYVNYVELLAAGDEMMPDEHARMQTTAAVIPPDDDRLIASYIRGATMPHPVVQAGGLASWRSTARRSTTSTKSHGPLWQRTARCPRQPCRSCAPSTVCQSAFRSSAPISTTAQRSPSLGWWSESSGGSCGRPIFEAGPRSERARAEPDDRR
jgi:hypothetical protein